MSSNTILIGIDFDVLYLGIIGTLKHLPLVILWDLYGSIWLIRGYLAALKQLNCSTMRMDGLLLVM